MAHCHTHTDTIVRPHNNTHTQIHLYNHTIINPHNFTHPHKHTIKQSSYHAHHHMVTITQSHAGTHTKIIHSQSYNHKSYTHVIINSCTHKTYTLSITPSHTSTPHDFTSIITPHIDQGTRSTLLRWSLRSSKSTRSTD